MLGWLMICDPAEQSAGQISEAIGASRASLTSNLRLLTSMGFLAWRTRPGERTVYYRMAEDAWSIVVQRQIASIAAFLDITRDGLALAQPGGGPGGAVRPGATGARHVRVDGQGVRRRPAATLATGPFRGLAEG
ncbi:GbsR/MarR family transcriptional regulator [Nonomuraea ferruginea]